MHIDQHLMCHAAGAQFMHAAHAMTGEQDGAEGFDPGFVDVGIDRSRSASSASPAPILRIMKPISTAASASRKIQPNSAPPMPTTTTSADAASARECRALAVSSGERRRRQRDSGSDTAPSLATTVRMAIQKASQPTGSAPMPLASCCPDCHMMPPPTAISETPSSRVEAVS